MSQKIEFVERALKPGARVSVLCREYGISRETGYKWINRFKREGPNGLEERSRRPTSAPLATAEDVVVAVVELREAYPRRGPKKLSTMLKRKLGEATPSVATIARILKRFGMVRRKSRFSRLNVVGQRPELRPTSCNEVWTVDFKGWWRVRDGDRCEPLTVRDAFSRYVLAVKVQRSASMPGVRQVFERLFRKHGIPQAIQCDNGGPFINVLARGGLTRLSAWWISLGIRVVRSRPACPQDNGGHERMHRDISADVEAFPASSLLAEQRACDRWRLEFNQVRPHEALGGKTPAEVYESGSRRSLKPTRHFYPPTWIVRTATSRGILNLGAAQISAGLALGGERVALEPLGGTKHRLWFRDLDLGTLDLPMSNLVIDQVVNTHFRSGSRTRRRRTKAS